MSAPLGNKYHWKGGKYKKNGYVVILNKNHPQKDKDGYVKEHRLVMEKHLGRYLTPEEVVHHINGIRTDDRIKNLLLFNNNQEHMSWHFKKKMPKDCENCPLVRKFLEELKE